MDTNRRILIDNATLSGIERITGQSRIINLNYIDNDILCLEKIITAILFSDQVIAVDDYKNSHRSQRLRNFDYIDFIKIEEPLYTSLTTEAASFARGMAFSFEGSKPAGDIVSFFESLRIDPQLRWDIWVSSEYLTLTFLVDDNNNTSYERAIDSAFRTEVNDSGLVATGTSYQPEIVVAGHPEVDDIKALIKSMSSTNPNYAGSDGKSALERIVFGYGWAAERSHFYNAVAHIQNADLYLAPLRDAFCESCVRIDYHTQAAALIEKLKVKTQYTLVSILEPTGQAKFAIKLPFFTAYLISKTDNPSQCIELALRMRSMPEFKECRIIFHNLQHLEPGNRINEINGILKYLEQSCDSLMKKYSVSTESGLQFSLSLGLTGVNVGTSIKLNQLFRRYRNHSFTRVFRNIAQDMINVERMGGLYEKVRSSIKEHPDANHPKISTTPKYMERKEGQRSRPAEL